jgi:hypothetical protein
MRRRDFIKVVASSAIPWPFAARGQQPTMPVIGFVHAASPAQFGAFVDHWVKAKNSKAPVVKRETEEDWER